MSFFAQLLGGAVSGYAGGALQDINDREKMTAQMALLHEKQQGQLELQRQRAEDQRALRELTAAQGGRRGGGGGDGTNVFDMLMNADTPEKQQRAVALLDAFGGSDGAALVADKVYGRGATVAASPTAGDFARFDRGDPGAEAVPQTTVERAAYDRDKGQQALQRLYALILDPAKTDDFSKAERQFGLNDFGAAASGQAMGRGASLEDAATTFNRISSPKDESEKNALAWARIEAALSRTAAQAEASSGRDKSAEARALDRQISDAYKAKDQARPKDKPDHQRRIDQMEAQRSAMSASPSVETQPARNAPSIKNPPVTTAGSAKSRADAWKGRFQ